jgi:hypothetical protein
VITKSNIWKKIKEELVEYNRAKKFTKELMKRIKEMPQDENQNGTSATNNS